jgi:hypothetical protein
MFHVKRDAMFHVKRRAHRTLPIMGRWRAVMGAVRDAVALPRPVVLDFTARPAARFAAAGYQPVDWYNTLASRENNGSISRNLALEVAAVQRVRNQVCSIGTLPIRTYRGLDVDTNVHTLLRQVDPDVANVVTFAATLEDLLFDGLSWWEITAQDFDGYPTAARHVPLSSVSPKQPTGGKPAPLPSGYNAGSPAGKYVWIDGDPVHISRVIRFDSPNPGMLKANARAIHRARLLDRLASTYADNPRPLDYFTDNASFDGDELSDDDVEVFLGQWADSRRRKATAKVPSQLEYHAGDQISPADLQLVELQRQASLEVANGGGVHPEDIGVPTTSTTYFNAQDRRVSKVNETYAPFMKAITDRLSMGDVTRRGYDVRYDLTDYLKPDTATQATVAATLIGAGIMTADEARPWFNLSGPAPAAPDPVPAVAPAGVQAARPAAVTFATTAKFTTTSTARFAVDKESRTIRGLGIPYGVPGTKFGTTYVFDGPGSAVPPGSGRVKHLEEHATPVGVLTEWKEQSDGVHVALSVMPGDEGDKLLAKAEHGIYDGLSAGIDWEGSEPAMSRDGSTITFSAKNPATVLEVSTTAMPVFDSARVTSVAASRTTTRTRKEPDMPCDKCGQIHEGACATPATTPETEPETEPQKWNNPDSPGPGTSAVFSAEQTAALAAAGITLAAPGTRATVDPTRARAAVTMVNEALPYRFSRTPKFTPLGRTYEWGVQDGDHSFGADLRAAMYQGDAEGHTEAGRRVLAALGYAAKETFAGVASTDIAGLNPNIQKPDMYVDVPDYRYPVMNLIGRGGPPNGIQPFTFPKFSSSSTLVAPHVEGTEPAQGSFVATTQTVTPTATSGEVNLTRETIDMGGNPAAQTLVFNKMVQGWNEALETNAATFLNTLTAATDISLNTGATAGQPPTSAQLFGNWTAALSALPFVRGYSFEAMVIEQNLYKAFAACLDTNGRPLFPMVSPMNANGSSAPRFTSIDLGGVTGVPSWALTATPGSLNNSWLFDPATVYGWATQPQRLDFPGRKPADGSYAPIAWVGMGIWGYSAFANTDINGVRQVTYDTTT